MALEALYKDSKYRSNGVIEEFAKLNKMTTQPSRFGLTTKGRDTGEPTEA